MKPNVKFLCAFLVVFVIEAVIALFVRDNFIRPYVGDILVPVLLYCLVKIFIPGKNVFIPVYIFAFAVLIEFGQYFKLAGHLGLAGNRIARVVIGSTFDLKDIACYFVGCAGLLIFEMVRRKQR